MPARMAVMTRVTRYLIFAVSSLANHFILAKANHFNLANDRARIASSGHSQPPPSRRHGRTVANSSGKPDRVV